MEELQEFFKKIPKQHLTNLLIEMENDGDDKKKQEALVQELAYKTSFSRETISKSIQENIYREVARRWMKGIE